MARGCGAQATCDGNRRGHALPDAVVVPLTALPAGAVAADPAAVHEVIQRAHPDRRADDVGQAAPGPREDRRDVVERQRGLLLDITHRANVRVGAELARNEAETGGDHPDGVGAEVGGDGGIDDVLYGCVPFCRE